MARNNYYKLHCQWDALTYRHSTFTRCVYGLAHFANQSMYSIKCLEIQMSVNETRKMDDIRKISKFLHERNRRSPRNNASKAGEKIDMQKSIINRRYVMRKEKRFWFSVAVMTRWTSWEDSLPRMFTPHPRPLRQPVENRIRIEHFWKIVVMFHLHLRGSSAHRW